MISNVFQVLQWTQFCDSQSDRQREALGKTICLLTLTRETQKVLSSNCIKLTNDDFRITFKSHAHFQSLTKYLHNFKKDPAIIIGGVAFTRYSVSICFVEVEPNQTAIKVIKII